MALQTMYQSRAPEILYIPRHRAQVPGLNFTIFHLPPTSYHLPIKCGNGQAGLAADGFGDGIDFGVAQRGDKRFGGAAGDSVDLD